MTYVNSDGKVFKEPLALPDGAVCYNPTPEMLAQAGYYPKPPESAPASSGGQLRVYKFDRYKVILALGDGWAAKRAELEAAGLLDLFMAAPYLSTADEFFKAIYDDLPPEEKRVLHTECRYGN
ncbi:MAG: hypothetical protein IKQ82_04485 [Lentisphaeria bacterium]|nr:hypothetical protein [Lentisphaeria bacterium]